MIVKAFPETSTGNSTAAITYTSDGISEDTVRAGVIAFHNHFPTWVDAGGVQETQALIDPSTADPDELGIQYVLNVTNYRTSL
ncbi:hypothetical protein BGW36DRAFT_424025 [Talaromyces proteolyticus]|uniref:Uncharacterized protein n=1 Tax=Talaromyces proteolyticus TaxID=1131652 RepID=A0AAD4KWH6_9EURO|nr:uncharacterized protein BGW36DRAFT_424025 [Talaromyces proteolyticus]KAH8701724.1 hypothetical protein BGW36DRAFT_424025 [Talaromyces proteolyticus]